MHSLIYIDVFNEKDTIIQMAHCSFDPHIQDIMGTLIIGATLIMLHPGGTLNFDYLVKTIREKQITCIKTVPSLFHSFFTFLQQSNDLNIMKYLRSVCSGGM